MSSRDAAPNGTPQSSWAPQGAAPTLRHWLERLAATGRVATIDQPVSLEHELAAVAKRLDGEQAAIFLKPGGHAIPVVSGFMSKRAGIAEAMGVPEAALLQRFRNAAGPPVPWHQLPR